MEVITNLMNYRKEIVQLYDSSLSKNLRDIERILKDRQIYTHKLFSDYKKLLTSSSKHVTNKWNKGDKYIRTEYMLEAFSIYYPRKFLELSIMVDAMINILDDLLDMDLDKKNKTIYILEYLRVFSLYSLNRPGRTIQKNMAVYFNKLISLAIAESQYLRLISKEKSLENIIKHSIDLLLTRSLDIDIFVEIATSDINDKRETEYIKDSARTFRAFNILKKDVFDIEHDKRQGQETLVTYMFDSKKQLFEDYIKGVSKALLVKQNRIESEVEKLGRKCKMPIKGFTMMLERDVYELNTYLLNLHK